MDGKIDLNGTAMTPPGDLPAALSAQSVGAFPFSLVLTDPRQEDHPIVYVNPAFTRTTGYQPEEVVGRNCRFMQGPGTQPQARAAIRRALEAGEACTVDIQNYRADGTAFPNRLMLSPLRDENGEIVYFLGVQSDTTADVGTAGEAREMRERLRELQHRVKNHLAMILSMIRVEARNRAPEEVAPRLTRRIGALATLYEAFSNADDGAIDSVSAESFLGRVVEALHKIDDRDDIEIAQDIAPVLLKMEVADRLALFLSEVLTNALQHGMKDRATGRITVGLSAEGDRGTLVVEDDGNGLGETEWPGSASVGSRITEDLVSRLDGRLKVETGEWGTRVSLAFPLNPAAD
ncbi:PAS domain-containing protein [Jannaschia ovalis]|uniref:histidine kinase n=1 Tax=Jannaschia ovalis TaxID=3038773 RepID=A0ABY8LJ37_9RHOB|nr:PAS domain-containing protein [Jannaschia sp. GRR-S6-38]WGH80204.1 PAS domain-containing protein [Jannaschia sp. GRR-S6-38]